MGSTSTDTEAPVVTLNGNNPATVSVGNTYADLGATVTDNVDQNLGYHIAVDGVDSADPTNPVIDTSVAGTHTITYTATDQAGNAGTATRTVNVESTTASPAEITPAPDLASSSPSS